MKYTDMSKKKNILKKNQSSKGLAGLFVLLTVLAVIGAVTYFFRDKIKQAFNPISVIGSSSHTSLKQTDGRTNILILGSDKRDA